MNLVVLSLFLFVSTCRASSHVARDPTPPPAAVLLISVDSFRGDFAERIQRQRAANSPPIPSRLWEMIEKGAFARGGLTAAFPPSTFPSLHTLVTGLYPEHHGVISDVIYEPRTNATADLRTRQAENDWAYGGEPIWVTVGKAGGGSARVGCHMWPGCENGGAEGVTEFVPFAANTIWHGRIDKAVEWLRDGVRLVLVSSPDIDSTDGPNSDAMDDALIRFDTDVDYLLKRLEQEELLDRVNVIIASGHGIATVLHDQPILPETAPHDSYLRSRTPAMWLVEPAVGDGGQNETMAYFKQFEHLQVYGKEQTPDEWHYRKSDRISPIVVVAEPGYMLSMPSDQHRKGLAGYDVSRSDMRGSFIGFGPAFVANSTVPDSIRSVDVYQLVCTLLGIRAAPNNGSTVSFVDFVQPSYLKELAGDSGTMTIYTAVIILSVVLVIGLAVIIWLCFRNGECDRRHQDDRELTTAGTASSFDTGAPAVSEKLPIMHKYDSELVILELDDDGIKA